MLNTAQVDARRRIEAMPLEELDPSDPALFENDTVGFVFDRLRRDDPVHRTRSVVSGEFWSVTRWEDIMAVDTQPQIYSSDWRQGGITLFTPPEGMVRMPNFISMDPPEHDVQSAPSWRRATWPTWPA
jgi:cytochrome P450